MAISTIRTTEFSRAVKERLDLFFAGIGQGFNSYVLYQSRAAEIDRLVQKSDAELAAMGLKRQDIPEYVFRDILHI